MQEIGWYDLEENNTGALCARLSTSAEVSCLFYNLIFFFSERNQQILKKIRKMSCRLIKDKFQNHI